MHITRKHGYIILLSIIAFILLFFGIYWLCGQKEDNLPTDYEQIKAKGEITILTMSESTTYFTYRDEPMGFHYDMAKAFCEANGLEMIVKTVSNMNQLIEMINSGEGDLIAYPMPIQNELKDSVIYCGLNLITHQVLVQRTNRDSLVNDVTELVGKKVTVQKNSKFHQRLENLNAEIGGGIEIDINEADSIAVEDLIEMVANKNINYTLCDDYLAKLNKTYYRNINTNLKVSFDQRASWAVAKHATHLAQVLDEWYNTNEQQPRYTAILKKYFELGKQPLSGEYNLSSLAKGQVSPYDDLFKKYTKGTRFSWQLLAAISFQESRFKNGKTSWAGAAGIMGLMPNTARAYGISLDDRMSPEASIKVAINLIKKLDMIMKDIEDPNERTKFVLAAYNGGIGHITDGRALALKHGDNNQLWDGHVRNWVMRKHDPQYYNDPVCKSGYFRGTETLNYVDKVLRFKEVFKSRSSK